MSYHWFTVLVIGCLIGLLPAPGVVRAESPAAGIAQDQPGSAPVEPIGFIGIVERKNIYQVISNMRGVVGGLNVSSGAAVSRGDPLLVISPLDPRFAKISISSPVDDGIIVGRHVENGHFVDVNTLLLEVASGQHYSTVVHIPNYEVKYFKLENSIEMSLYSTDSKSQVLPPPAGINIHPPANGRSLYRVELAIDCRKLACAKMNLTGSLVQVKVNPGGGEGVRLSRQEAADSGGGPKGAGK